VGVVQILTYLYLHTHHPLYNVGQEEGAEPEEEEGAVHGPA